MRHEDRMRRFFSNKSSTQSTKEEPVEVVINEVVETVSLDVISPAEELAVSNPVAEEPETVVIQETLQEKVEEKFKKKKIK